MSLSLCETKKFPPGKRKGVGGGKKKKKKELAHTHTPHTCI